MCSSASLYRKTVLIPAPGSVNQAVQIVTKLLLLASVWLLVMLYLTSGHRKSSDSQSFNKVAERVLLRLQEKLKGVEEGTVLSVGGQVNLLIQQAMDPKNLSRLFPGWQAWV